jgi:dTDP-4-dehydrorhamnose reductase
MLHGPSTFLEESSVTILVKAFLGTNGPVPLDTYQTRYPAYTLDVVTLILNLLPLLIEGSLPSKILHFCPSEPFTKMEMGSIMAEIVGEDPNRAIPAPEQKGIVRPKNVRLLCPNIEALGLMKVTPFREAIKISLDSIKEAGGLQLN